MSLNVLESYFPQLDLLGKTWLALGAEAFSLKLPGKNDPVWSVGTLNGDTRTMSAPILSAGKTIGLLQVAGLPSLQMQSRLEADASLISSLVPLERDVRDLTTELVTTRDQLVALYNLSIASRGCLNIRDLLLRLSSETLELIKAEYIFWLVRIPDEDQILWFQPELHVHEQKVWDLAEQMHIEGKHLWYSGEDQGETSFEPYRLLMVDMQVQGTDLAALGLLFDRDIELMSPDLKLIQAVAEFVAAQIANVVRYEAGVKLTRIQTEMDLAHRVQNSLLPKSLPEVPGLDIWATSRAASRIGGDFYDFFCRFQGDFAFVVGDISGKGIPAALLMAMTRIVLRTQSNGQAGSTPEAVLSRSNTDLYGDFTNLDTFATVFIGQIDVNQQCLVFANAGHSPVIHCPVNGHPRLIEADGPPLGILPDSLACNQWLGLEPGDVFIVGTDGLNDARNAHGDRFGYDRLLEVVKSLVHLSAVEIGQGIEAAVQSFSDTKLQDDDQTLVVIKRTNL